MYGINCIEDIEWIGENVWGAGGISSRLQRAESAPAARRDLLHDARIGRLRGAAGDARACFDAVMLAYNPLGFHLQSHH